VQFPVAGLQQAPGGCGHGFGEQTVPMPNQVLGATHSVWIVSVQVPSGWQHAP